MEVLGREVPAPIESLYDEVVALRPDAGIKFQRFLPPKGLDIQAQHVPEYTGDSEIRLVDGYEFGALAHVLLHTLLFRKGYPIATTHVGSDVNVAAVAQVLTCCVSHGELAGEAADRPDLEPFWRQELAKHPGLDDLAGLEADPLAAWRLADAISQSVAGSEALRERLQQEHIEGWQVVEKLLETAERCRELSAMRWFRGMAGLLAYFDRLTAARDAAAMPPSHAVVLSLVISEPQLQRPADRLVDVVALERDVIGFRHKQEGALFHIRFALPGRQKRELAEVRAGLKQQCEDFLNEYWVPYTVDLNVARPR